MRLWRVAFCVVAIGSLVALAGCGGYPEYLSWGAKPNLHATTSTEYQATNYEIVGVVRATGEGTCILGLYAAGKDGQGLLWEQAQMMTQGNFTGIKDIAAYTEYKAILPPVVCEFKTTYIGTVVRERRTPAMGTGLPMPMPMPTPTP
ncbi:MAG: hypothetical protein FJ290_12160 [Planctomycetes bacterium]|nr:hypothetical protein [Planctomycetota bacterium]